MKKPREAAIIFPMINAPRQPSWREDLKRWENEGGAPRSGRRSHDSGSMLLPRAEPALYYFNIRTGNGLVEDPEGDVCSDIQSVLEKARANASVLVLQGDRVDENRRDWCFEIVDRTNQHVLTVTFSGTPGHREK